MQDFVHQQYHYFQSHSLWFSCILGFHEKTRIPHAWIPCFPGNGWLQEMGSNEEQPMRRFAVWIGKTLRGAVSSVVSPTNLASSECGNSWEWRSPEGFFKKGLFTAKIVKPWNLIVFWKATWNLPSWDIIYIYIFIIDIYRERMFDVNMNYQSNT